MEYRSVREIAEKWQVSPRYIQRLLHDGRIPGAKKFERSWMIPEGAQRPGEPCREQSAPDAPPCPYYPCVILSTMLPIDCCDMGGSLAALPEDQRMQCMAELSYMRGDYAAVLEYWSSVTPESPAYICAGTIAMCAAVGSGDNAAFDQSLEAMERLRDEAQDGDTRLLAETALATLYVSLYSPETLPDWAKTGEFADFPESLKPWAAYICAKYLHATKQYETLLYFAAATVSLCARPNLLSPLDTYLRMLCGAACCGLGDSAGACRWLRAACELALPWGFITPFLENTMNFTGEIELVLQSEWPAQYARINMNRGEVWRNWVTMHNRLTQDEITLLLSAQEYRLGQFLSNGATYAEAGRRMNISVSRVKDLVTSMYGKLNISAKRELTRFIL